MMRYVIIAIVISIPLVSHGEPYVGGKLALNQATWERVADQSSDFEQTYNAGYSIGGMLQVRRWVPFVLQSELSFTSRGSHVKMNDQRVGLFNMGYTDVTLLGRGEYSFRHLSPYIVGGLQFGYLLTATVTNRDGSKGDVRSGHRAVDVAVVIGAGVALGPFRWGVMSLEMRYDHGLRSEDVVDNVDFFNRTLSLNLGYEYRRAPRGPQDRDHDGLFDDSDTCPDKPEDFNDFEDDDGCPDGDKDDDADGVLDFQDQCRGEAEDMDGVEDDDGCPDLDEPAPGDDPEDAPTEGEPRPDGDDDPIGTPDNPEASLLHPPSCTKVSVTLYQGRPHARP